MVIPVILPNTPSPTGNTCSDRPGMTNAARTAGVADVEAVDEGVALIVDDGLTIVLLNTLPPVDMVQFWTSWIWLPTGVNVRTQVSFIGPFAVWMVFVIVTEGIEALREEDAAWRRAIAAFSRDGNAFTNPSEHKAR